jgi:hypothetical protein
MPSESYSQYVALFQQLKRAVEKGDGEALRALELELAQLPESELEVASMAVHDLSAHLPMRGATHFDRLIAQRRGTTRTIAERGVGRAVKRQPAQPRANFSPVAVSR